MYNIIISKSQLVEVGIFSLALASSSYSSNSCKRKKKLVKYRNNISISRNFSFLQTNDENPGNGARDLAMLFMTIWVPLRLTTAEDPS